MEPLIFSFNPDLENAMGETNFWQVYVFETNNYNAVKS